MRAVQAVLKIAKYKFEHLITQSDEEMSEKQESIAAQIFAGACVVLCVYSLYHERFAIPNSIKKRILDLAQVKSNDGVDKLLTVHTTVTCSNLERVYGKRL